MNKLNTLNEKEQRTAIHAKLTENGIKVTKTLVDQVLDVAGDLTFNALIQGKGIKVQKLGSLEPSIHKATTYKVPVLDEDGLAIPGEFREGVVPAKLHVRFVESDVLLEAMNTVQF